MKPLTKTIIESAQKIADGSNAKAIFLYADILPEEKILKVLNKKENIIIITKYPGKFEDAKQHVKGLIQIPPVHFSRVAKIKVAILLGLSKGILSKGDVIVCLSGISETGILDTILVTEIGEEFEIFSTPKKSDIHKHIRSEFFERVLSITTSLANEGREGKPVGSIFILGDEENVKEYVQQMIINPFKGYPKEERNILDESIEETVKEFSAIDGAFVIGDDGTIISAGSYLKAAYHGDPLPQGLGARHAAAAAITASTKAIAFVISESTGTVRIFKDGHIVTDIEKSH